MKQIAKMFFPVRLAFASASMFAVLSTRCVFAPGKKHWSLLKLGLGKKHWSAIKPLSLPCRKDLLTQSVTRSFHDPRLSLRRFFRAKRPYACLRLNTFYPTWRARFEYGRCVKNTQQFQRNKIHDFHLVSTTVCHLMLFHVRNNFMFENYENRAPPETLTLLAPSVYDTLQI